MDLFRRILNMAKSKQLAALSGLIGAFMIHLVVGAIYRWNMISYYVGVYYDDQVWAPIGAPLFMLTCGLTMRLGWVLSNRNGSIPVLGVALGAAVVSQFASSDMPSLFCKILLIKTFWSSTTSSMAWLRGSCSCLLFSSAINSSLLWSWLQILLFLQGRGWELFFSEPLILSALQLLMPIRRWLMSNLKYMCNRIFQDALSGQLSSIWALDWLEFCWWFQWSEEITIKIQHKGSLMKISQLIAKPKNKPLKAEFFGLLLSWYFLSAQETSTW